MHRKDSAILRPELARKISPWIINSGQLTGAVGKSALIAGMVLSLYGPEHNAFLYFLGPWVCPTLTALCWSSVFARRRFRIYRGSPFGQNLYINSGDDPAVVRLAELFNSNEARQHLWHETLKLSGILFVIMGTAALLLRHSLEWTYPSQMNHFFWSARRGVAGYWFWPGLFGCSLFAFLTLVSDYYRWCLMTWAKREAPYHETSK